MLKTSSYVDIYVACIWS